MARSLAVVAFIAAVAAAALYVFERPTVARESVIAADLMATNQATLVSLDCDPEIPIGISGARFSCRAEFKAGEVKRSSSRWIAPGRSSRSASAPSRRGSTRPIRGTDS